MDTTRYWNRSAFSSSCPAPRHPSPSLVPIIIMGCKSGSEGHRAQKHRESGALGSVVSAACFLESAHAVQTQPPFYAGSGTFLPRPEAWTQT